MIIDQSQFSERLTQAIGVGMVIMNDQQRSATIAAPLHAEAMSDDDWLLVLQAASEMRRELEALGYTVTG